MFQNAVKIAIRNLLKNKTFSFINLFGLTTGTACCLYILLYVQDQRNFDRQHHGIDNLYRVTTELHVPDGNHIPPLATCSPPIVPAMHSEFPEVEQVARVCSPPGVDRNLFRVGDKVFYAEKGFLADSTFFRLFDYHFLAGNPGHALDEPYTTVLSEKLALKLFNTTEATGQTVGIGVGQGEQKFKVTGVFNADLGKSHIMPEFFISMNSGGIGDYIRTDDSWAGNNFIYGYIRLKPGADPKALESKLPDFLQKHGAQQFKELGMSKTLYLQPVRSIHTDAHLSADISPNTSNRFLNILLLIAAIIQLVACINFMNLTTARSARRAQEVGVRKAIGAGRGALVRQFLGESMVLTFVAMVLALPLVWLTMPLLNQLTGAEVSGAFYRNWSVGLLVAGLVLVTGLAAGSYPALYLSSFQPVVVLRGMKSARGGKAAIWFRKGLVVSQFVISAALIIGALVIRLQLNYMLDRDLGFEKNQKVVFQFRTQESQSKVGIFRDELSRLPEVQAASAVAVYPSQFVYNDMAFFKEGQNMNSATDIQFTYADENYLKALKIKLLQGRFFTPADTAVDQSASRVVINQTALRQLGIPEDKATGMVLRSDFRERHFQFTIIGVMQDFFMQSLTNEVRPFMLLTAAPEQMANVVVDVKTGDYAAFFKTAEARWNALLPGVPFEHSFLDEELEKMYTSEQRLAHIISAFTFMAILISCLGLFGLSVFAAEQRAKEIGIRKVLGATTLGITQLLSLEFLQLVAVALVLAVPLGWYAMDRWLEGFAYPVQVTWWVYALAGLATIGIALLTVSFQSVKAGLTNPVKSLRSE